jgi:hypothetical protein
MTDEIIIQHGTTMVRRRRLASGEVMPWHRDPFHRVAVALSCDVLSSFIEYRDGESPCGSRSRPDRSIGKSRSPHSSSGELGKQMYEQITAFLLDRPDAVAQPCER